MAQVEPDFAVSTLVYPKRLLSFLNLYPEKRHRFFHIIFWTMFFCVSFMEFGQTYYMVFNLSNLAEMAGTCTTVTTTFQVRRKLKKKI